MAEQVSARPAPPPTETLRDLFVCEDNEGYGCGHEDHIAVLAALSSVETLVKEASHALELIQSGIETHEFLAEPVDDDFHTAVFTLAAALAPFSVAAAERTAGRD